MDVINKASTYAAMPIFPAKMALIPLAGVNFLAFMRLRRATGGDEPAGGSALAVLSMLFPSPLVGEGGLAKRGRMRGVPGNANASLRWNTPHPSRRYRADPPSPTRGEGKARSHHLL
ncbi:MAG: hypothetical protein EOS27_26180 [Mesorhizobium sp.]|nr:MAG: hypothetical protein EOS27_26180 [Mesorhizobium sp.]